MIVKRVRTEEFVVELAARVVVGIVEGGGATVVVVVVDVDVGERVVVVGVVEEVCCEVVELVEL